MGRASWLAGFCVAIAVAVAPSVVRAQQVRGTILDSTSRLPVPGAVVTLIDADGNLIARRLADERGRYAISFDPRATRLRVVRIGFRPRDVPFTQFPHGLGAADVGMLAIPTMLEPARVAARQCPKRSDSERALGLWEQARAGLLAAVVANESNPAAMVRLGYRRAMLTTRANAPITRQIVTLDSAARTTNSYVAARRASDFVDLGFSEVADGVRWLYAPDAGVLLEDGFGNGYCMRLAPRNRSRPGDAGLAFAPADRKKGRVDIVGTLWIDTVARALRDIEYRYIGTDPDVDDFRPGGTISFREVPNGSVIIDRWDIRSIDNQMAAIMGTNWGSAPGDYYATTSGGEVAHARWPDGSRYDGSLANLVIAARSYAGAPASGYTVKLADTPYSETLGESGEFTVNDLLPGPYAVVVLDTRLARIGYELTTGFQFTAKRDSTHVFTVPLPTLEEWTVRRCASDRQYVVGDSVLIVARVVDASGAPRTGAEWHALAEVPVDSTSVRWAPLARQGWTGSDGIIALCTGTLQPNQRLKFTVRESRGPLTEFVETITGNMTVIPIRLPRLPYRPRP